ncbi:hypothetical protein [Streptomyces sp. cg35]|uniref:hypothetical protein n=1 Tax=Streptomyces sp. cg35 TaxID=3421650 RepID=UPI003D181DC3
MPRFLLGIAIACVFAGLAHSVFHASTALTIAIGAFVAIGVWCRAWEMFWDAVGYALAVAVGAFRG